MRVSDEDMVPSFCATVRSASARDGECAASHVVAVPLGDRALYRRGRGAALTSSSRRADGRHKRGDRCAQGSSQVSSSTRQPGNEGHRRVRHGERRSLLSSVYYALPYLLAFALHMGAVLSVLGVLGGTVGERTLIPAALLLAALVLLFATPSRRRPYGHRVEHRRGRSAGRDGRSNAQDGQVAPAWIADGPGRTRIFNQEIRP